MVHGKALEWQGANRKTRGESWQWDRWVSATDTACRCYSHVRSSGLDLAKKFSSTLALRDTEFGCTGVGLAAAG